MLDTILIGEFPEHNPLQQACVVACLPPPLELVRANANVPDPHVLLKVPTIVNMWVMGFA